MAPNDLTNERKAALRIVAHSGHAMTDAMRAAGNARAPVFYLQVRAARVLGARRALSDAEVGALGVARVVDEFRERGGSSALVFVEVGGRLYRHAVPRP